MIKIFGVTECVAYIEYLARERDSAQGRNRILDHGKIRLDSVIAWNGTSAHTLDGSTVEAIYFEGNEADATQVEQAAPARQAGVEGCRIVGRLIDVRMTQQGSGLALCTNGLRTAPFRAISTRVGTLVAIAFDGSLGVSVREACAIAGVESIRTAHANPTAQVDPQSGTIRVRKYR